jgi:hypothetical protein
MKLDISSHDGHRITNRFSAPWCDTCMVPIFHDSTWCAECYGRGYKRRMSNLYNGQGGKRYNCGACKGTGACKPIPCHYCGVPGQIVIASGIEGVASVPLPTCRGCYVVRVQKGVENQPQFELLATLLAKLTESDGGQ